MSHTKGCMIRLSIIQPVVSYHVALNFLQKKECIGAVVGLSKINNNFGELSLNINPIYFLKPDMTFHSYEIFFI
jgi:hypothetical protein